MTIPTRQSLREQGKRGENKIRSLRTETTNRLCIIVRTTRNRQGYLAQKDGVRDSENFYGVLLLTSGVEEGWVAGEKKREAGKKRVVGGRGDG